jgi:hypothetical protein
MSLERMIEELEEYHRREALDEPLSLKDYARWDMLRDKVAEGYAEEARKYDND